MTDKTPTSDNTGQQDRIQGSAALIVGRGPRSTVVTDRPETSTFAMSSIIFPSVTVPGHTLKPLLRKENQRTPFGIMESSTQQTEVAVQYRFRGTLRDGTATGGTFTTDDVAAWVEARWHQRWWNLTILRGNEEVGGINRRDGQGPLIWWAES